MSQVHPMVHQGYKGPDVVEAFQAIRVDGVAHVMSRWGGDLPLRLSIRSHSPDGFEWGYAGSGPAQLALAMLAEVFESLNGNPRNADGPHQRFKFEVICTIPQEWNTWYVSYHAVKEWLQLDTIAQEMKRREPMPLNSGNGQAES